VKNSRRGSRLNNDCSDVVRDVERRREVYGADERKVRKGCREAFHFRLAKNRRFNGPRSWLLFAIIKEVVNVTAFSSIAGWSVGADQSRWYISCEMAGTLSTGGSLSSCAYYVSFWILAQISSGTPHEIGIVGRPFRKSYLPHVIRGSFYHKSGFYLSEWISSGMKAEGEKKGEELSSRGARKRCHLLRRSSNSSRLAGTSVTPIFPCHRSLIITFSPNARRQLRASRRRDHALRGFRIKILEKIPFLTVITIEIDREIIPSENWGNITRSCHEFNDTFYQIYQIHRLDYFD